MVVPSPFRRSIESPVSMRIIGLQEIEKSPGANRDVSRIVRSYPGVSFSPIGYRISNRWKEEGVGNEYLAKYPVKE